MCECISKYVYCMLKCATVLHFLPAAFRNLRPYSRSCLPCLKMCECIVFFCEMCECISKCIYCILKCVTVLHFLLGAFSNLLLYCSFRLPYSKTRDCIALVSKMCECITKCAYLIIKCMNVQQQMLTLWPGPVWPGIPPVCSRHPRVWSRHPRVCSRHPRGLLQAPPRSVPCRAVPCRAVACVV